MKSVKRFFLIFGASFLLNPVFAQTDFPGVPPSPETNPFLDPSFQDFVETAYGYRNPKNMWGKPLQRFPPVAQSPGRGAANVINDFRDALTSLPVTTLMTSRPARAPVSSLSLIKLNSAAADPAPAVKAAAHGAAKSAPGQYYKVTFANESGPLSSYVSPLDPGALSGFRAGDYVFISVLPKTDDHAAVIKDLSGTGFKFAGEKTYFNGSGKKTFLLGWAPHSKLESIYKNPGVRRVSIEKQSSGAPFRTSIRFTLRAPGGESSGAFVSDFIRQLTSSAGFASESVVRLPQNSGSAKFTAFEITGSLPVDMVGAVSRSPFVAAVEFKDKSL